MARWCDGGSGGWGGGDVVNDGYGVGGSGVRKEPLRRRVWRIVVVCKESSVRFSLTLGIPRSFGDPLEVYECLLLLRIVG